MDLLVVRHAIAAEGEDDTARPLTAKGRKRFARVARALAASGPAVEAVLHSPKQRAIETAELLAPLCARAELWPGLAIAPDHELLERLAAGGNAAVVGHSPHLEALIAWLVLGDPTEGDAFDLRKGGWAWLEGDPRPGGMVLRAFVPPRIGARRREPARSTKAS